MAMTATVDNANARVDLFVDFTPVGGTHTTAVVVRIHPDGSEHFVLGANPVLLLGEQAILYDNTAPLDTPVSYRATSNTGAVLTAGPVTITGGGFVWFKDPARPWANLRVDLCITPSPTDCDTVLTDPIALIELGAEARADDANLFPILDREHPDDVYARRKGVVTSVTFASRTLEAVDDIYVLFTAGGPLFIQAPAVYGWPDRYVQPGVLDMTYVSRDQRKPWRLWNVPLTVVDAPVGPVQGVAGATWCDIQETYPDWASLTAMGMTWGQVLMGDATPTPPLSGYGSGVYGGPPNYGV